MATSLKNQFSYPLSCEQQGLWMLYKLSPESVAYNMVHTARLIGELDIDIGREVWQKLCARHQVLRTTYSDFNGEPMQVVSQNSDLPLEVIDAANWNDVQLKDTILQQANCPFNLETGPAIRISLFTRSPQESILSLIIHQIAGELPSLKLLIEEFQALYIAEIESANSITNPLQYLNTQYVDYVSWQGQMLNSEKGEQLWHYWHSQLDGASTTLNLPTDKMRPTLQTYNGASHIVECDRQLQQRLKELEIALGGRASAIAESVSLYDTLLTAFFILLYRVCHQEDILVGSPMDNSQKQEFQSIVGCFTNSVVLRTRVDSNLTFEQLLKQVSQTVKDAKTHQEYPFILLVEKIKKIRESSQNPLFQVGFAWQQRSYNSSVERSNGLRIEPYLPTLHQSSATLDLEPIIIELDDKLTIVWQYNTDLFEPSTIAGIAEYFQTLLTSIVDHPEARITKLPILSSSQRQILKTRQNPVQPAHTFTEFPKEALLTSVTARFEEQVRKYPQKIAVQTKQGACSYETLNNHANAIARAIIRKRGSDSERIGLLLEHDTQMLAGILGVMKAGKAYVPLDASYPESRLNYILEDSKTTVILTNNQNYPLAQKLSKEGFAIVNLEEIDTEESPPNLQSTITPDSIACILYTSGSTGNPKGVVHTQRNLLHYVRTYTNVLHLSHEDRMTALSSFNFISSILDNFGALLNGATAYLINLKELGFAKLAQWIAEQGITIYESTPTVYRLWLENIGNNQFPQLRIIILGGEEVTKKDVQLYQDNFSEDCLFINGIGATEVAYFLGFNMNQSTASEITITVPVGYPTSDDMEVLLLDESGEETDIYGELAIRSPYLALGYWQRPDLTAKEFFPDPEGGDKRIYRTGNLARLKPNGVWEHKGRKDFQVKINGIRVELGEIEAVLSQHPKIQKNAVVVRDDIFKDNKCIVAYLVAKESQPTNSQLRAFLKTKLPDYMVPGVFVFVDAMPLTPNNKVNRRALPAPNVDNISQESGNIAPRTPIERQLSQIWSEVLNVDAVGVRDNFFVLGGHSLLALRLMARIEEQLGIHLPLATLFAEPTIEGQANLLSEQRDLRSDSPLVPIQIAGELPPLFFVHPIGGNVLCYAELARYLGDKRPFYGLQSVGLSGEKEPLTKIEDMADIYIEALQEIQPHGPYYLGGWSMGGIVAWEMAQQLQQLGQEVALLALIDSHVPDASSSSEPVDEASLANFLARDLSGLFGTELPVSPVDLEQLQPEEQLQRIFAEAKRLNLLPPEVSLEQMSYLFQIFKANLMALARYQPQPYSGLVALFCAETSAEDRDWSPLVIGSLETYTIPGDHYGIMRLPHVRIFAEEMEACLNR